MKRNLIVLLLILSLLFIVSCGLQPIKGIESSITQMNDITRCKITADQADVRTGCSDKTPVLLTVNKDSKHDVISIVADWYAVKLPNNDIGFVPIKQCTPIVPDEISPNTTGNSTLNGPPDTSSGPIPGTTLGTGQNTKQKTPDTTKTNNSTLTAQEQEMIALVNQARSQNNVPALIVDMALTKIARIKSQDMIDNNYFSHNSPKYGSPFDMMKAFGINYVQAGENIAGNQTVQKAHDALMNSPGHRQNILSTDYTHIGIGIQKGGQYGYMFTQDFISKPR